MNFKRLYTKPASRRLLFSFKMRSFFFVLLLGPTSIIFSCKEDNEPFRPSVFVDNTPILTRSAAELQTYLVSSGLNLPPSALVYDVELNKVTYRTKYRGEEILASGVAILPVMDGTFDLISFQHGTLVAKNDVPSMQPINSTELILYSALASAGFITVVPDYIGFGTSADLFHPYYVEEPTADAVIDIIKAGREFAIIQNKNVTERVFLAGYSQGGYATMAAHKALEENPEPNMDLIASFPAAGGYDVKGMQEYFFHQEIYNDPFYIAYVALAYEEYYEWNGTAELLFKEPYASKISSLFDGLRGASSINANLTTDISELIQEDVLTGINSNEKYGFLVNAFNQNSLVDWTPTIRMSMFHGNADVTVPYENSVSVYENFISNGASPDKVTFTTLENATHSSGIVPYIERFVPELLLMK